MLLVYCLSQNGCSLLLLYFIGVVRTAYPGDRETQDKYLVVIKATVEQIGGPSGTTTVTINLSDVNDNPPRFQHSKLNVFSSFFTI